MGKVVCKLGGKRIVKPEFAQELNINNIMAKVRRGAPLSSSFDSNRALFGDFSQIPDYSVMRDKIIAADNMFMALPAALRADFRNDPGLFVEQVSKPEGHEILAKHGLLKKLPKEVTKVEDKAQPKAP